MVIWTSQNNFRQRRKADCTIKLCAKEVSIVRDAASNAVKAFACMSNETAVQIIFFDWEKDLIMNVGRMA